MPAGILRTGRQALGPTAQLINTPLMYVVINLYLCEMSRHICFLYLTLYSFSLSYLFLHSA